MLNYIIKRIVVLIPMLLFISVLVFGALELMPGDPLSYLLNPDDITSNTANIEKLRESLGLNAPVYIRYIKWLGRSLQGDFGYSLATGVSISDMLKTRIPATLELSGMALLISTVIGVTLGFISSIKQNTPIDYMNTVAGMVGVSVPNFFFAMCGILVFAVKLKWLPVSGRLVYGADTFWERLPNIILPSLVLGFALTGALMRNVRGSMLDVLNNDYIKTARSKGLTKTRVYIKHAFRNALTPIMLLLCFRIPMLFGGAIIIESIFSWGGMGQMLLQGVTSKDYPVVMFTVMASALIILLISVLVDIITALLDPRVQME